MAGRVDEHVKGLEAEVNVLKHLDHPNIVRYLVRAPQSSLQKPYPLQQSPVSYGAVELRCKCRIDRFIHVLVILKGPLFGLHLHH